MLARRRQHRPGHAAALYLRHGFTFSGETGDLLPDGIRRDQIMAKTLSPAAGP
jgi:hypothetical protein